MAGWLDRGFERNTAGLLGSQTDPQTLDLMRSQYKRAAIADMVGSISGRNPGYLKNTLGGFEGLLDAQLEQQTARQKAKEEQQQRDMMLKWIGTHPNMDANQMAQAATMTHTMGANKAMEAISGRTPTSPGQQNQDYFGNVVGSAPTTKTQELEEAIAMRDRFQPGTETHRAWRQQVQRLTENSPGVVVNTGNTGPQLGSIPPGHVLNQQPDGGYAMQPIPGSPAAREVEAAEQAQLLRDTQTSRAGGTVVQDANRLLGILSSAGPFAAGTGAKVGLAFPESDASAMNQLIESIQSNIGFDQLSQMRQASTTGGALGNVTELQLKQLQSVLGGLDVRGRPSMLEDNVKRVHNIYMDIVHGTPEQIRQVAELRGIPLEEVQPLMYRHPLSFDDFGNPSGQRPQAVPADSGDSRRVLRYNPATGRVE